MSQPFHIEPGTVGFAVLLILAIVLLFWPTPQKKTQPKSEPSPRKDPLRPYNPSLPNPLRSHDWPIEEIKPFSITITGFDLMLDPHFRPLVFQHIKPRNPAAIHDWLQSATEPQMTAFMEDMGSILWGVPHNGYKITYVKDARTGEKTYNFQVYSKDFAN